MAAMAIGTLLVAPRALAEPRPYQPAVLRLSLTTLEGEETSVIDHTLIPAEGSPIGKRTNVNRTQFGKDLRNLYQQISKIVHYPQGCCLFSFISSLSFPLQECCCSSKIFRSKEPSF